MVGDLLYWFGGLLGLAAIWGLFKVCDVFRSRRRKTILDHLTFRPAEKDFEPDLPREPGETRISTAKLDRSPNLRPVRRYDVYEDGADPYRHY